eukprot:GHVT01076624.1.p2 GENE.GHVT01076624.1~~GHVT01076624.1.p2  ORF type:complete len:172 (+),score=8.08 GHVT01076624.1:86-601(+)
MVNLGFRVDSGKGSPVPRTAWAVAWQVQVEALRSVVCRRTRSRAAIPMRSLSTAFVLSASAALLIIAARRMSTMPLLIGSGIPSPLCSAALPLEFHRGSLKLTLLSGSGTISAGVGLFLLHGTAAGPKSTFGSFKHGLILIFSVRPSGIIRVLLRSGGSSSVPILSYLLPC